MLSPEHYLLTCSLTPTFPAAFSVLSLLCPTSEPNILLVSLSRLATEFERTRSELQGFLFKANSEFQQSDSRPLHQASEGSPATSWEASPALPAHPSPTRFFPSAIPQPPPAQVSTAASCDPTSILSSTPSAWLLIPKDASPLSLCSEPLVFPHFFSKLGTVSLGQHLRPSFPGLTPTHSPTEHKARGQCFPIQLSLCSSVRLCHFCEVLPTRSVSSEPLQRSRPTSVEKHFLVSDQGLIASLWSVLHTQGPC